MRELRAGPGDGIVEMGVARAGLVYFAGDDGVHSGEPWVLDPGATAQSVGLRCARTPPAPLLDASDPSRPRPQPIRVAGVVAGATTKKASPALLAGALRPPESSLCSKRSAATILRPSGPVLGASAHVVVSNEPTDSLGFLLFGLRRDAPQPVLGCALYVDPLAWMPLAVPLAAGDLPIANDPSLAGALVAMQAAYLATDPEFRLAASNAVYLTLGS